MRSNQAGWVNIALVLVIILVGVAFVGGIKKSSFLSVVETVDLLQPIIKIAEPGKKSIQLQSLEFTRETPTPTIPGVTTLPSPTPTTPQGRTPRPPNPGITNNPAPTNPPPSDDNICVPGAPRSSGCVCQKELKEVLWCNKPSVACDCPFSSGDALKECAIDRTGYCYFRKDRQGYTNYANDPSCIYSCIDKPIIYLYPTEPTYVNVKLDIPGYVTVSLPQYPESTGWQNVFALPGGILQYQNASYYSLYYETAVAKTIRPDRGLFIKTENLSTELADLAIKYGLNGFETKEFMDYWLPELKELDMPYIFVSVYNDTEKDEIDKVLFNPYPETFIHFLTYFKGVNAPYTVAPLEIPSTPPARIGFTAVEWGGTIDRGSETLNFQ
jgi:hypothetical protein